MTVYPIAPMAKPRPRVVRKGGFSTTYMPATYVKWKADVAKLGIRLPDAFVVAFHFAMPKSWSKKKRTAMAGAPHQQRPDLDNLLGGLMDACRRDDSSIHQVSAIKVWALADAIEVLS